MLVDTRTCLVMVDRDSRAVSSSLAISYDTAELLKAPVSMPTTPAISRSIMMAKMQSSTRVKARWSASALPEVSSPCPAMYRIFAHLLLVFNILRG